MSDAVKELAQENVSHSMTWEIPSYVKIVTQPDVMQWRNGMRKYVIKLRAALDTLRVNTVEALLLECSSDDEFRTLIQKRLDEATDIDRVCPAFVLLRQVLTPDVVSTLTRMNYIKRFYSHFLTCPLSYGLWVTEATTNMTERVIERQQQQQQGRSSDETINLVVRSDENASSTAAVNPVEHQNCSVGNPLATSSCKSSPMTEDEDSDDQSIDACIAARKRRTKSGKTHCYIILIACVNLIQNYMTRDWMFLGMCNPSASATTILSDGRQTAEDGHQKAEDVGVATHSGEPASQDDRGADTGEFDHKRQRSDPSASGDQSFL